VLSSVTPAKAGIQDCHRSLATDVAGSRPSFQRKLASRGPIVHKQPAVYILASERNGTLYIGVTSDLVKRVWQHKNNVVDGFTKRYSVHQLVWYEPHETMESAIKREKALKNWKRIWKLELIETSNPSWQDLYLHSALLA
jgi:putative endonuclease